MTDCAGPWRRSPQGARDEGRANVKRVVDVLLAAMLAPLLVIPVALIALLVRLTSPGAAFYWSDRIGADNRIFRMPKFRTMRVGTPVVATHLLAHAGEHVTPLGRLLRRTSLDELPQVWSILRGDMSFVGPRPALYNQDDLKQMRTEAGVHVLTPGLTGWAQINGRDGLEIPEKVRLDAEYLRRRSLAFDLRIIVRTVVQAMTGSGVAH